MTIQDWTKRTIDDHLAHLWAIYTLADPEVLTDRDREIMGILERREE